MDAVVDRSITLPDPASTESAPPAAVPFHLHELAAPAPNTDGFTCSQCGTAAYLDVEDIRPVESNGDGWVMTEYSCTSCETFYAHEVQVQALAKYLAIVDAPSGVLQFGRHYVHCGVPMQEAEMNLFPTFGTTLFMVNPAPPSLEEAPEPAMPGRVLKCRCGFQISTPH